MLGCLLLRARGQQGATLISLLVSAAISVLLGVAILATLKAAMALFDRQKTYSQAQAAFIWLQHHFDRRFHQAGDFGVLRLDHGTSVRYPSNFPSVEWKTIAEHRGAYITAQQAAFVWIDPAYYAVSQQTAGHILLRGANDLHIATSQWWVFADAEGMELAYLAPQHFHATPEGIQIDHRWQRHFLSDIAIGRLHWVTYALRPAGLYAIEFGGRTEPVLTASSIEWEWTKTDKAAGLSVQFLGIPWISGWAH